MVKFVNIKKWLHCNIFTLLTENGFEDSFCSETSCERFAPDSKSVGVKNCFGDGG